MHSIYDMNNECKILQISLNIKIVKVVTRSNIFIKLLLLRFKMLLVQCTHLHLCTCHPKHADSFWLIFHCRLMFSTQKPSLVLNWVRLFLGWFCSYLLFLLIFRINSSLILASSPSGFNEINQIG